MTQPLPCRLTIVPPKNTLAGVVDALTHFPEWQGVLAASELDQGIVFRREPPFSLSGSHASGELAGKPVRDRDITRIRHWFEDAMGCALSKQHVIDAARIVADDHAFHPVRDYLSGLIWDGTPRVDRWLEDYCAVMPTSEPHAALVRSVARRWLVACVARAMKPGSKVDTMLILEGRQGIGKSTALATLAGEGLHCDSVIDFASKEACQTLQGVWIFELPELDALLRHETSVIKAFLSRSVDRFRVPYGRAPENVPRSVVFCGTVNHGGYLRDRTGNRRFWVVRCEGRLDVDGLGAARDALWAEAVHLYKSGEPWHLSPEHETLMHGEHEGRLECDPWDEILSAQLGPQVVTYRTVRDRCVGPGIPGVRFAMGSALGFLPSPAVLQGWGSFKKFSRHQVASAIPSRRTSSSPRSALSSLPRVYCSLFDETKRVPPWVLAIEGSLAPWAHDDATSGCIVNILARQTAQRLGTLECCF